MSEDEQKKVVPPSREVPDPFIVTEKNTMLSVYSPEEKAYHEWYGRMQEAETLGWFDKLIKESGCRTIKQSKELRETQIDHPLSAWSLFYMGWKLALKWRDNKDKYENPEETETEGNSE